MPARGYVEQGRGVTANIEIAGIKDALKTLNKIDKSLRREITKDYKGIVQNVIDDAYQAIPLKEPLSGMARVWAPKPGTYQIFPWSNNNNIKAMINTKRVKEYAGQNVNLATFVVKWLNPDAGIFDFLDSGVMGSRLNAKFGAPSRVMWKAWERNKDDVNARMTDLVKRVMDKTSKELM
jgi:methionine synthase II (cobalamin-independent)